MPDIRRFSSRRQRLDHAFLSVKLKEAKSYKRIAGYFRSSVFELVGSKDDRSRCEPLGALLAGSRQAGCGTTNERAVVIYPVHP